MNKLLTLVVLGLLTPHPALARGFSNRSANAPSASEKRSDKIKVEQTLSKLTDDLFQAYPKQEASALDRILADDLTVINPDGSTGNKAGEMGSLRSGALKLESVTNDEVKVRVFGDSAVVTGRATIKGRIEGREIHDQNRYTTVFVKRRGQWQVIAMQITRVAKQ